MPWIKRTTLYTIKQGKRQFCQINRPREYIQISFRAVTDTIVVGGLSIPFLTEHNSKEKYLAIAYTNQKPKLKTNLSKIK